jgi:hypothetical protein
VCRINALSAEIRYQLGSKDIITYPAHHGYLSAKPGRGNGLISAFATGYGLQITTNDGFSRPGKPGHLGN